MITQLEYLLRAEKKNPLLLLDENKILIYCTADASALLGMPTCCLVNKTIFDLIQNFPDSTSDPYLYSGSDKITYKIGPIALYVTQTSKAIVTEISIYPIKLEGKNYLLVQFMPVSNQDDTLFHLNRLQQVVEQSNHSTMITDYTGVIQYVNPAFEKLTGYYRTDAVGKTPALLKSDSHSIEFYENFWKTLRSGKEFSCIFINRKKCGVLYHEETRIRPFLDGHGKITHFVSTGRDVSENIQALERLEHLAHFDFLTGLPNRKLFKDRLHREIIHAERYGIGFALLYLDLDRFKPINDTYGHVVGDYYLQSVASLLSDSLRDEDTISRLGGDEFAVILKETSMKSHVIKVIGTILDNLKRGTVIDGRHFPISASIGCSLFPEDAADERSLIDRADKAMYQVKTAGGNGYGFFEHGQYCNPAIKPADSVQGSLERSHPHASHSVSAIYIR